MNTDATHSDEALWAYVHGELGEPERGAFDKAMDASEGLRQRVESARQLDRLLRSALPCAEAPGAADEDALTERVLAAWEREQATLSGHRFTRAWFRRHRWANVAGLAAAAAVTLCLLPVLRVEQGVRWSAPAVSAGAYRGAESAAVDVTALDQQDTAARCQEALRAAFERAVKAGGGECPSGLVFSLRLQALRDGAFSVCVQARRNRGQLLGEWSGDYSGLQAFLNYADVSAAQMADTVCGFSGAGEERKRP